MEDDSTDLAPSIQEAIQLAKTVANTLKSPPRVYNEDFSRVDLWTDQPGSVYQWQYWSALTGTPTLACDHTICCFILTLKVEPSIIELPVSWDKKLRSWFMREKPQPKTYFDGYYIIFDHQSWVESQYLHDDKVREWYEIKKDSIEKELNSQHAYRDSLGHYWRFHVKPDGTVDFVGEAEDKLPSDPSLRMLPC